MAADCRARCVDGADLGVAEHAATIANADPRCPVHGDPDAVARYIAALERVASSARVTADAAPGGAGPRLHALRDLRVALAELDKEDQPHAELVTPVQDVVDATLAAGIDRYNARRQ